jgi:hypothetical protein
VRGLASANKCSYIYSAYIYIACYICTAIHFLTTRLLLATCLCVHSALESHVAPSLGIEANPWASDPAGTISNVHFNNVVFDTPCSRNVIAGDDKTSAKISHVFFDGLKYSNTCIRSPTGGKFSKFDPKTTDDIEFKC